MEKKQLLIISKCKEFTSKLEEQISLSFETTSVKNLHAAYPLALANLPDVILIDFASLEQDDFKAIKKFKSTHFLNKSFLFLIAEKGNKKIIDREVKDHVDHVIYGSSSIICLVEEVENFISNKRSLSNYWKDSFMGLFNLMDQPVILLQNDKVIAMNDSFKRDFFMLHKENIKLSDLIGDRSKAKIKEAINRFVKGKHMKTASTVNLMVNNRLRQAKIVLSKLDKTLKGQLIMLIDFTGNECPLNDKIGSISQEATETLHERLDEDQSFTIREREVLDLLCKGYKTREISDALCISSKTIEKHRANIIRKTNSGTMLESVVYAFNHNMIDI